jgi:hypothetical protein
MLQRQKGLTCGSKIQVTPSPTDRVSYHSAGLARGIGA